MAGSISAGGLLYVAITATPDDRGVIDAPAFAAHAIVERSAAVWTVAAAAMVVVQAASDAGLPASN